ncbi:MAG: DUF4350 domain-containing protein [Alphaproteobacteria bacterium]|nr:DUF4350 domain-containing protein [Alphaproteobacteria bacterium]
MLALYTDVLSARPGETVHVFASASSFRNCRLEVSRIGRSSEMVLGEDGISVGVQDTPPHADMRGCGWRACTSVEIGEGWRSGYYDFTLRDPSGEHAHHFVCVKPARNTRTANAALVLSTNTYHAYNWWGGANAYCDVTALMAREQSLAKAMSGSIGILSTQRPFSPLIVAAPRDTPRLVNERPRGFKERPWASSPEWARVNHASPYDRSAGFLHKWEHFFTAWVEDQGISLDYFTDYDLDVEEGILNGYSAVLVAGHSEYWSARQRDRVEDFVKQGGNLAVFGGNTAFWKVRWEANGTSLVCHKWNGLEREPAAGREATHLWSHPTFGRPEAELLGLTFLFGGYHRLGMCVARGAGGYTVYRDRHWALEGTDLYYGDVIGADLPLLGYENDGCRFSFGPDGLPVPIAGLGVPSNLEIIALAPCAFGEDASSGYRPLIPPERLEVCADIVLGDRGEAAQRAMLRGHAVMAAFQCGKGEVFNCGTTEWAHGLKARDPFVERITTNVLSRFRVGN